MKDTVNNGIRTEWETYRVTACCEVEPRTRITGESSCPECGTFDARTIKGARVKDRYVDDDMAERVDAKLSENKEE